MNPIVRHIRAKYQIAGLDPLYWILFIPLCLGMFVGFWVELPMDLRNQDWFGALRWVTVAVMAAILMGGKVSTGKRVQMNKIAMPSLPISRLARKSAEVAFLVTLLWLARVIHLFFVGDVALVKETIIGTISMIPIFYVFTPRDRGDREYSALDSILVVILTGMYIKSGIYSSIGSTVIASAVLVVLVEYAHRIELQIVQKFSFDSGYAGEMQRMALNPTARFQRDLWLGSLKQNRLQIFLILVAELLGVLLCVVFLLPQLYLVVWTGVLYYFLFCCLITPAGTYSLVSETGQKSSFFSDFDGSFLAAWSVLPIAPRLIVRGTYLYILTIASGFWMATLMTFELMGWDYSFYFWIPFLVAIPCLAGLMTMSAIGKKGWSIFLSVLFCAELIIGMGLVDPPDGPGVISVLILGVFLVVSVVPVIPVLKNG